MMVHCIFLHMLCFLIVHICLKQPGHWSLLQAGSSHLPVLPQSPGCWPLESCSSLILDQQQFPSQVTYLKRGLEPRLHLCKDQSTDTRHESGSQYRAEAALA